MLRSNPSAVPVNGVTLGRVSYSAQSRRLNRYIVPESDKPMQSLRRTSQLNHEDRRQP
jgi:hypothetical protein